MRRAASTAATRSSTPATKRSWRKAAAKRPLGSTLKGTPATPRPEVQGSNGEVKQHGQLASPATPEAAEAQPGPEAQPKPSAQDGEDREESLEPETAQAEAGLAQNVAQRSENAVYRPGCSDHSSDVSAVWTHRANTSSQAEAVAALSAPPSAADLRRRVRPACPDRVRT